jgi:hypothetical protein
MLVSKITRNLVFEKWLCYINVGETYKYTSIITIHMKKIGPFVLRKGQTPIVVVLLSMLVIFTFVFVLTRGYEFLIYTGVIFIFMLLIAFANGRVKFPNWVLWGLVLWAFMHLSGGSVYIKETLLYKVILIPITESVFRYDQFVHIVGFGFATAAMYYVLKPLLRLDIEKKFALGLIVVMAGLGVGAFNEIVEFVLTLLLPQTNVGGYINTGFDLVSDLVGAVLAMAVILFNEY